MSNITYGDLPNGLTTARIGRPVAPAIQVPCGQSVPLGCRSSVLIGPPDDKLGSHQNLPCHSM